MRNLIFSILGSLGLALLGLPALMPTVTDAGGTPDHHANLHAFQTADGQAAFKAVADEAQDDSGVAAEDAGSNGAADNDEAYSDNSGASSDDNAKAKTPNQKSTTKRAKKHLQVDLSDLVIRPV